MTKEKYASIREKGLPIMLSGIFWFLLAHGYRMSNNLYAHDSLNLIVQNDSAWQIALGRFIHPFLLFLRGGVSSAWLVSFCAMIWLVLSSYFVAEILEIKSLACKFIVSGLLICHPTIVGLNAGFLQCLDFYTLSLFLSVFGVYLWKKKTIFSYVLSCFSLMISMGIYQSYICVAIGLFMILLFNKLEKESSFKDFILTAVKMGITLIASGILYYFVWFIFRKIFGIWAADTYNGMANLIDYSQVSLWDLIKQTYYRVFLYLANPDTFVTMTFREKSLSIVWLCFLRVINSFILCILLFKVGERFVKKKLPLWQNLIRTVILVLFPLGINIVYIISKGMEHALMIYAFVLFYIFVLSLVDDEINSDIHISVKKVAGIITMLCLLCVIWSNTVYANQVYLKKSLQDSAAASLLTRILSDLEETDEYVPGETPVAFCGYFENSPYIKEASGIEDIHSYGMGKTSLTYLSTEYSYITYNLEVPINGSYISPEDERVKAMPVYPLEGSIQDVDGILVIKISDEWEF